MSGTGEHASAAMVGTQVGAGVFSYTITLTDTGTTPIGTFWFAWVPGQDYLSARPTVTGSPSGWTATITGGFPGDGFAIEWVAGAGSAIGIGGVSAAFTFTSTETPAQMGAAAPFFAGPATTTSFIYAGAPLSSAGAKITIPVTVACFRAGTAIRTLDGDVPVEALGAGDVVVTAEGRGRPVTWVGSREVACDGRPELWPVRVQAGALGPQTPLRDLYVSPDHALLLLGVLVPARHLINGSTIARAEMETVTYHHLALAEHDAILAEGAAAESYLAMGDGSGFAGSAWTGGGPGFAREVGSRFDLVVSGPILAEIRREIARRADWLTPSSRFGHAA